jgi:nucleotide-binding universal stress UspA family protein
MFRNILLATDGTELSARAATAAIELAALAKAHLFVLSVAQKLLPAAAEFEIAMHPQDIVKIEDQALARARENVDAVISTAQQRGVTATGLWLAANLIADTIIDQAKQHDCQLIVMASHGRKGWARLLMGSETLDVLTHSKISTLVVR